MTDNNTYDELPYSDYAFEYACPEHMYTISKIFGHDAPKVENARILELGCAFGSNIIGFAERYPNSKVTGIDLSQVQIERGLEEVKNLGLKNIELKAMSIGDIGASFGKFDYIICHGVYSWVPKEIQEKILEIAEKNLSPNGLVYISYNCLPGANILNSFREMMQFHSSMFNTTKDRITQAKAFVSFVKEGLEGSKSPYYTLLQSEIDIINTVGDSYIQHEYLEKGNSEFYFSDFMKSAAEHKLQYLGDARLPSMYIGNLPQKAQAKMAEINDIVRSEQYMDFITNRRFRCTILCNQNGKINRNLNDATLENMWLSSNFSPVKPLEEINFLDSSLKCDFILNGQSITSSSPITSCILYAISNAKGAYVSTEDIIAFVKSKISNFDNEKDTVTIRVELLKLVFSSILQILAIKPVAADHISQYPLASEINRMRIKNNFDILISQYNNARGFGQSDRIVMSMLDGKSNIEQIIEKTDKALIEANLSLNIDGKTVTDKDARSKLIRELVLNALQLFLLYGFLVK